MKLRYPAICFIVEPVKEGTYQIEYKLSSKKRWVCVSVLDELVERATGVGPKAYQERCRISFSRICDLMFS